MSKAQNVESLLSIPGVGKSISQDLFENGIKKVSDLKGKNPEKLYSKSNKLAGVTQDRCLLYVFRCAVYFAETDESNRNPDMLKWWNWKDSK
ncbi:MAG: helix-hairpin-helix domain-containing protein [bacterium]